MGRLKIFRDFRIRFLLSSKEPIMVLNRFFAKSYFTTPSVRIKSRAKLFNLGNRGVSVSYINNRCLRTGHPRIVHRYFKISRMEFRRLAKLGFVKGYKRSSWLVMWFRWCVGNFKVHKYCH